MADDKIETAWTPYGPITFDPMTCEACGEVVRSSEWVEHARTHNPSAYRDGWPCDCRVGKPCRKHRTAAWISTPGHSPHKEEADG